VLCARESSPEGGCRGSCSTRYSAEGKRRRGWIRTDNQQLNHGCPHGQHNAFLHLTCSPVRTEVKSRPVWKTFSWQLFTAYRFFPERPGSHVSGLALVPGPDWNQSKPDPPGLRRTSSRAKPAQIPNGTSKQIEAARQGVCRLARSIHDMPQPVKAAAVPPESWFGDRQSRHVQRGVWARLRRDYVKCKNRDRVTRERRSLHHELSGPP
jgi:hypothetical protein